MMNETAVRRPCIGEVVSVLHRAGKFEIVAVQGQGTVRLRPLIVAPDRDLDEVPWEALEFPDHWHAPSQTPVGQASEGFGVDAKTDAAIPLLNKRWHFVALGAVLVLIVLLLALLGSRMAIS
jgi:hypothetical protein